MDGGILVEQALEGPLVAEVEGIVEGLSFQWMGVSVDGRI
jgi:hypothetical protein